MTDGLSLSMAALACLVTVPVSLWSRSDGGGAKRLLPWLFCLGALAAVTASDWLTFTVFLELSSLALFFLVLPKDRGTAFLYLYTQLAGGALLLLGTALSSSAQAPLAMGPVPENLFPLFVVGLGCKAALPGLHFWLPPTHSRAPAGTSALLSGYAVKMGIYGLLRLAPSPSPPLMAAGVIMALLGAFHAPLQSDAKRLLAYSTLGQLGFIVAALAAGTASGRAAALFHVVAHALSKGLLFLSVGSLERTYGTRDLDELGRGGKDHPLLLALVLLGALSLAGAPLTAGAWGKGLIKTALIGWPLAKASLALAGLGTTMALSRLVVSAFFRPLEAKAGGKGPAGIHYLALALFAAPLLALSVASFVKLPPADLLTGVLSDGSLLALGFVLFAGLSHLLPRPRRSCDVEDLLPPLGKGLRRPLRRLRLLHSGHLGLYLFAFICTACLLFVFLSP